MHSSWCLAFEIYNTAITTKMYKYASIVIIIVLNDLIVTCLTTVRGHCGVTIFHHGGMIAPSPPV